MTQESKIRLMLGIFVGLLIGMNLIGGKIVTILGVSTSVAIFMTPLTFLITDIVEEVKGKKETQQFIWIGVAALAMTLIYTAIFVSLEPADRYEINDSYVSIFGVSIRMTIASIIAFIISQSHDVWAFEFWKRKTKGKMLWLRNNASTMVSQAIDTLLFMTIAFYGISDKFTFGFIISLAIPYYIFKLIFAALDTPFVYAGVKWLGAEKK